MFVMLADRLVRSGKKDDAAKVLARCEKELPACNIPYTDDDSQLASLWAEVGNAKEAERVAKAVLTYNLQYFNFLNSLSASTIESYRSTNYYLFASTIEALQALGTAKSKEEKAFRNKVEKLYDTPAFNSGMSTYYQQMGG